MQGRRRFYCVTCGQYRDRRQVTAEADDEGRKYYYCCKCGSAVMQMGKVRKAWDDELIEFVISRDAVEDFL